MRSDMYILDDNGTTRRAPWVEAARWFETANRHIGNTIVGPPKRRVRVSTVFISIDHNWTPAGPPAIFETMVFDGEFSNRDIDCQRYSTLIEALEGHREMVIQCLAEYGEPAREDDSFGYHPAVLRRKETKQ